MSEFLKPDPDAVPPGISRRAALRSMFGFAVAAEAGIVVGGMSAAADYAANFAFHRQAGTPDFADENAGCVDRPGSTKPCSEEQKKHLTLTPSQRFYTAVTAPIVEETVFRAGPSALVDLAQRGVQGSPSEVLAKGVKAGTEDLTRAEFIGGALSSLAFGLAHNIGTGFKSFDTQSIPAGHTFSGIMYWLIARRHGITKSVAAHMGINTLTTFQRR